MICVELSWKRCILMFFHVLVICVEFSWGAVFYISFHDFCGDALSLRGSGLNLHLDAF